MNRPKFVIFNACLQNVKKKNQVALTLLKLFREATNCPQDFENAAMPDSVSETGYEN